MPLLFLFSLVVLSIGFYQKEKKLKIVGWSGIAISILGYAALLIAFGFSDM